jgi:hypothetical protein
VPDDLRWMRTQASLLGMPWPLVHTRHAVYVAGGLVRLRDDSRCPPRVPTRRRGRGAVLYNGR